MADVLARRRLLTSALAPSCWTTPTSSCPGSRATWSRPGGAASPAASTRRSSRTDSTPTSTSTPGWCAAPGPVIEQLAEQAAGVPVCVVLTDDRARLLVRLDTTAAIGRAADGNNFAEGFGYDEGAVGTNGVGTVLESGGSVHVVGAEHFVEPLQAYACAGAPVRDPFTGRIEGVLDVSCRAEHSSPILHSLVTLGGRPDPGRAAARPGHRPAGAVRPLHPGRRPHPARRARGRAADGAGEHRAADPAGPRTTSPPCRTTPGSSCSAAPPSTTGWTCRRASGCGCAAPRSRSAARSPGWSRWSRWCGRPTAWRCRGRCRLAAAAGAAEHQPGLAGGVDGGGRGAAGRARRCWSSGSPGAAGAGCSPTWTGRCTARGTSSRSGAEADPRGRIRHGPARPAGRAAPTSTGGPGVAARAARRAARLAGPARGHRRGRRGLRTRGRRPARRVPPLGDGAAAAQPVRRPPGAGDGPARRAGARPRRAAVRRGAAHAGPPRLAGQRAGAARRARRGAAPASGGGGGGR